MKPHKMPPETRASRLSRSISRYSAQTIKSPRTLSISALHSVHKCPVTTPEDRIYVNNHCSEHLSPVTAPVAVRVANRRLFCGWLVCESFKRK